MGRACRDFPCGLIPAFLYFIYNKTVADQPDFLGYRTKLRRSGGLGVRPVFE